MPTAEVDIFKALFLEALEKEAKGNMPHICHPGFFPSSVNQNLTTTICFAYVILVRSVSCLLGE